MRRTRLQPRAHDQLSLFAEQDDQIFLRVFQELKPRTLPPGFQIEYRPYAHASSSIQLERGHQRISVRMADLLQEAPEPVKEALAHILLRKLYRKPRSKPHDQRYKLYLNREDIRKQAISLQQTRGRKQLLPPQGKVYDLEKVFHELNGRFFEEPVRKPRLGWSPGSSRRLLGHFDPVHDAIVISRVFDRPSVPRLLMDYILYHEMLHIKHPIEYGPDRRRIHTKAFRQDERKFPQFERALQLLKKL